MVEGKAERHYVIANNVVTEGIESRNLKVEDGILTYICLVEERSAQVGQQTPCYDGEDTSDEGATDVL